ncbi:MAG TPA: hypothetical protein VLF95_07180 [Vicinamibacteria bacterium]|nr:hypothetical protein [Vicinamibacteria bacterium]
MPRPPAVLLVALAGLAPACGHRGDPLPPRRRTPPAPQEFRLAQRGDFLEVRAVAPAASVDGVAYEALTVEFLWVEGPQDLEKAGRRHAVRATPGRRVVETLPLPPPGATVRAAARGVAGGRKGQRTLTMALVTRTPPEAPRELAAALAEDGVALSWRGARPRPVESPGPGAKTPAPGAPAGVVVPPPPAPPTGPTPTPLQPDVPAPGPAPATAKTASEPGAEAEAAPEGPRTSGFFVYRRLGGAAYDTPLPEEPLERRSLSDTLVPRGTTACYVVRAVASTEPLVESAPSNEACIEVRDIAAPAPPAGLAVLPREAGLEILWSPSAEADIAGYRVYREAPGGASVRIAEVGATRAAWLDETAERGVVYRYTATAFDQSGNESERAEPVEASLP